jgi:phospholipid/cholesterol/gamma-HCH transport system substrate-binding protein
MKKQGLQNLIVGLFVFGVLVYGAYFIYQTSEESTILLSKVTVYTKMSNASGIKRYSPVRVHGIPAGKVERVWFSEEPGVDEVYFEMSLSKDYIDRVAISHPDLEAAPNDPEGIFGYIKISSEGLLGDNLVEIFAGDPKRAPGKAKEIIKKMAKRHVRKLYEDSGKGWDEDDPLVVAAIEQRAKELAGDVKGLDTGHVDDGYNIRSKGGGGGLAGITDSLDPVLGKVTEVLDEAKTQPGLIHALIYDDELVDSIKGTVASLDGAVAKVNGLVGELKPQVNSVVGKVDTAMVDLQGTLANVEDITRKINEGEGTLGALVTDKSVYEDLQAILGGAKRSEVVRQAVRYAKSRSKSEGSEGEKEK